MRTRPSVGSVIRLRILSSVVFPAPLRPMMPRTSPRRTEKLTSRRAQKSSVRGGEVLEDRGPRSEVSEEPGAEGEELEAKEEAPFSLRFALCGRKMPRAFSEIT